MTLHVSTRLHSKYFYWHIVLVYIVTVVTSWTLLFIRSLARLNNVCVNDRKLQLYGEWLNMPHNEKSTALHFALASPKSVAETDQISSWSFWSLEEIWRSTLSENHNKVFLKSKWPRSFWLWLLFWVLGCYTFVPDGGTVGLWCHFVPSLFKTHQDMQIFIYFRAYFGPQKGDLFEILNKKQSSICSGWLLVHRT